MQRITPFLWFDGQAEEAARFCASIFSSSRVGRITRYDEAAAAASGRPEGSDMTVELHLDGQEFTALDGGPHFAFSEAVSFVVNCETQEEIDHYWERLSEGGEPGRCGWLKDPFGLSWQVVPASLGRMLQDFDPARAGRVMRALLTMGKLDLARLEQASEEL